MLSDDVDGRRAAAGRTPPSGDHADRRRHGRCAGRLGARRPGCAPCHVHARRRQARCGRRGLLRLPGQYGAYRTGSATASRSRSRACTSARSSPTGAAGWPPQGRDPRHEVDDDGAGLSGCARAARNRLGDPGRRGSRDCRRHHLRRALPRRVHREIARRLCANHRRSSPTKAATLSRSCAPRSRC